MSVRTEHRDGVAIIYLQHPPVNSLSAALRVALGEALNAALTDDAVRAVVLTGEGELFCAGAEIREFNTAKSAQQPLLRELIAQIDAAAKPVVAAMHGMALGGGLELALGCHARAALRGTRLGLPEVRLGLLPGAGGTQRLPRLIGARAALAMIAGGDPVKADEALRLGLVDVVADTDVVSASLALSRELPSRALPPPADPVVYAEARQTAARRWRGCIAAQAAIDCVEAAARHDLVRGLEIERERFLELVQGEQSRAQRHLFFAERTAQKPPKADRAPRHIQRVGVVGAGTMGGGIAMSLANAGIAVVLVEREAAALERGLDIIRRNYAATLAKGRLTPEERDARLARIRGSVAMADLAEVDMVIEAAFEDLAVKREIFTVLDAVCRPDAILATNTSRLDINVIAGFTQRPQQVLGTHFFSPANVMTLLEVVRGDATSRAVIADVFALARRMGKLPVLVGVCDGFVGNRMVSPYTREAHFLLEEGATPQQVDGALQRFGLAMGPLRMADLAGLDISWAYRKRTAATRPAHLRYSRVADTLCEQGRLGQKTGAGFYRYAEGDRTPIPDPEVDAVIEACARADGIARGSLSDEDIVARTMYALVNEGARLLDEGIAARASDIDVIYVHGYGFPPFRGGPMFYAEQVGLAKVLASIESFHARHGELWTPAPLLQRLVRAGHARFSDAGAAA